MPSCGQRQKNRRRDKSRQKTFEKGPFQLRFTEGDNFNQKNTLRFRGLKFESDDEIEQKREGWKGLGFWLVDIQKFAFSLLMKIFSIHKINRFREISHDGPKRSVSPSSGKPISGSLNSAALLFVAGLWIGLLGACEGASFDDSRHSPKNRMDVAGMRLDLVEQAAQYAGGAGVVMRGDRIVYRWGDQTKLYDLKSTTKSFGSIALGLAIRDGHIDLNDPVVDRFPELGIPPAKKAATGWIDEITYFQLATHTAGFDKPGGYEPLLYRPGSAWAYSDGGSNWLADALTHIYQKDLKAILFERVFKPLGITATDLTWRDNHYRETQLNGIFRREFGSGISANVGAMAKIGQLFLRNGEWQGKEILPRTFVELVRRPINSISNLTVENDTQREFDGASRHYGLLWWNNGNGAIKDVPTDAFWSWGLYDSLIVVIPSLDIVVARAGETIPGKRTPSNYQVLEPFFKTIVAAVNFGAPYPNSPVVANLIWDDASQIVRKAAGSDNWPLTWADDDDLYTAYGDGYGFQPNTEKKLSLGFAKIVGNPPDHHGVNIRTAAEQLGEGTSGRKASGMLMVDGILYMWIRNANKDGQHSQLTWSHDYGKTWSWGAWVFEEFGYCTFINFGKNYENARDDFVYIVSHDGPSAYEPADQFVLIRVNKGEIRDKGAYEFFQGIDNSGSAAWTHDIAARGAVFEHKKNCFRSGITYSNGLRRYLWWQVKFPEAGGKSASMFHNRDTDPRYVGAFGIFEAPEPWGPWTTVFYTVDWDVGAGETGSFPTKWMSKDGNTIHLVFSGDDTFAVRKVDLIVSPERRN